MKIRDLIGLEVDTKDIIDDDFFTGLITIPMAQGGRRLVGMICRVYGENEIKGYKSLIPNPTRDTIKLGEFDTTEEATEVILNRDANDVEEVTEFMEYWIGQEDDYIVSMLYDVIDHRLNTVIDVEESVMDLGDNMYKVSCVVYRENKNRKDLLRLIKKHE